MTPKERADAFRALADWIEKQDGSFPLPNAGVCGRGSGDSKEAVRIYRALPDPSLSHYGSTSFLESKIGGLSLTYTFPREIFSFKDKEEEVMVIVEPPQQVVTTKKEKRVEWGADKSIEVVEMLARIA